MNQIGIGENDEVRDFMKIIVAYQAEHYAVIKKFGRYPSRNDALVNYKNELSSIMLFNSIKSKYFILSSFRVDRVQQKSLSG